MGNHPSIWMSTTEYRGSFKHVDRSILHLVGSVSSGKSACLKLLASSIFTHVIFSEPRLNQNRVLVSDTEVVVPDWELETASYLPLKELSRKKLLDASKERLDLLRNVCLQVMRERSLVQQTYKVVIEDKYLKRPVQPYYEHLVDLEKVEDQFLIKPIHQVIMFCLKWIRYLLAIIRYLLYTGLIDALIRAGHRRLFIRHAPRYKPQTTDDDDSNTFPNRFSGARTGMCCYLPIAS